MSYTPAPAGVLTTTVVNPYTIKSYITSAPPPNPAQPYVWFDAADSSTFALTGSQVMQWRSKGTNTVKAISSTGVVTYGAATQNGKQVVTFPATSQLTLSFSMPSQARAVFIVARNTTQMGTGANSWVMLNSSAGYGAEYYAGPLAPSGGPGSSTYRMSIDKSGIGGMITTPNTLADPYMVWRTYEFINSAVSTASNYMLTDGISLPLTNNSIASGYLTSVLARSINQATTNTGSDIAEIMVYNSEITVADRKVVENYLAYKWGVPYPPA